MRVQNLILVILGVVIFFLSFLAGGIAFHVPFPFGQIMWFSGLIFVAVGLWLNEKEKKE